MASRWQAPGLTAPSNTAERQGPSGMRPSAAGPGVGLGGAGAGREGADPPAPRPTQGTHSFLQHCLSPLSSLLWSAQFAIGELRGSGEAASNVPRLGSLSPCGLNERWGAGAWAALLFRCQSELRITLRCSPHGLSSGAPSPLLSRTPSSFPGTLAPHWGHAVEGKHRLGLAGIMRLSLVPQPSLW